jgi:hypothetical protein
MDQVKFSLDMLSFTIIIGTIIDALPSIAAAMSIVWLSMQMYDWIQVKRREM